MDRSLAVACGGKPSLGGVSYTSHSAKNRAALCRYIFANRLSAVKWRVASSDAANEANDCDPLKMRANESHASPSSINP
jgi:hypothetical protein